MPPSDQPTHTGQGVWLRPIEPQDYEPLRRYELSMTLGPRWRHRGSTPSPEAFVGSLWGGVLAQYLVQGDRQPEPLGIVTSYGHDLQSGTVWVAAARFEEASHPTAFLVGARMFVDHLFATWPFRKLYAEALAPNLEGIGRAATALFRTEGVLRDHAWVDGRYVDQHLLALHRCTWEALRTPGVRTPGLRGVDSLGSPEDAAGNHPCMDDFLADLTEDLARLPGELHPDVPLVELEFDSLDWLVLAERLDSLAGGEDASLGALDDLVTLRALHRWAIAARAARSRSGHAGPDADPPPGGRRI